MSGPHMIHRSTAARVVSILSAALLAACGGSDGDNEKAVTIQRDSYGVPHVFASSTRALYYGFGYAIAQDRLYQLEIAKRTGKGTVAEVLGPDHAALDVSTRSNLDFASIREQFAALSADDRAIFEGYASGVNARIKAVLKNKPELLPKEFADAGFEPSLWTPDDVALVWIGLILNRFFSGSAEVSNLNLLNQLTASKGSELGRQLYEQLRWLEDKSAPTIVPRPAATIADAKPASMATASARASGRPAKPGLRSPNGLQPLDGAVARAFRQESVRLSGLAATEDMPTASNAWVLAPGRTTGGRAVLYNGPQQGFQNPAFVHGIGLHGAGYSVTGATPIGLPAVLFGTNGTIAWGSTVGSLDTNDIYQEQLNPANQYEYRRNGVFVPMVQRTETIKVKGEADRTVVVYASDHGAVQSWDLANHTAYTAKRSWQGREVETLLGWTHAAKAKNWDQYMEQAARVSASITWFYADVEGNIGAAGLGRLPKRLAAQDIRFPASGDGSMEWQGFLPFSANPKSYNPAQGYLVSWNNQIADGLRADGANFSPVDRVNELQAQLSAKARFSNEEIWNFGSVAAQADLNARYFVPLITQATAALPASDPLRQAAELLRSWDMQLEDQNSDGYYDGPGTTVLRAWLAAMTGQLLADDLPAALLGPYTSLGYAGSGTAPGSISPASVSKVILNALLGSRAGVPQKYDFLNGEEPGAAVRRALASAVTSLTAAHGADPANWRTPVAKHTMSNSNAVGVPWATASQTVQAPQYLNRGTTNFRVVLAPGAVDMCSVTPGGQSGFVNQANLPSPHYADQLPLFARQACKPDAIGAANARAAARSTLELTVGAEP